MTEPSLDIDALDFIPEDPISPRGAEDGVNGTILDKVGAEEPKASKPSMFRKYVIGEPQGKPRERKVKEKKATPPMPRGGKLADGLQDIYVTIGMMLMVVDPVCAQAVITAAPECAKSMEKLAKENEAVRRVLLKMLETSAWGSVIAAHLPILMAVAAHHVPALQRGLQPPAPSFAGSTLPNEDERSGAGEGVSDGV